MKTIELKTKATKDKPAAIVATFQAQDYTYQSVSEKYGQTRAEEIFENAVISMLKGRVNTAIQRAKDSNQPYDANKVAQDVADKFEPILERSSTGAVNTSSNAKIGAATKALLERVSKGEIDVAQFTAELKTITDQVLADEAAKAAAKSAEAHTN